MLTLRTVLCPTDFSDVSARAETYAAALARHYDASLHLLHVDPPMPALAPDPVVVLAHLHRVDFDRCLARHEAAARRRWSAADVEKGLGFQSRIVEPAAFAQWFHHDADRTNGPRQRVPACFQELL